MTRPTAIAPAQRTEALSVLRRTLSGLRPLVTMSRDGLVVMALESTSSGPAPATLDAPLLVDEAASSGDLVIHEVNGGSVPTLEAVTQKRPVLLLAGDAVIGGKQNRIVNVTIWLPAAAATPIPVSCLEAGRWDAGRAFTSGRRVDVRMRGLVNRMVGEQTIRDNAEQPDAAPSYRADQAGIWAEIGHRSGRAGVHSPTSALHDLYRSEESDVTAIAAAFPVPTGADGVAIAIGGRLVSLELFGDRSILARAWPRLMESAASAYLDHRRAVAAGLEAEPAHRYPDRGALERMLKRAIATLDSAALSASVGEGIDARLTGEKVHGAALVRERQVAHLELFRADVA